MDKRIKRALKTGVDERNNALYYGCPRCGWEIPLSAKKCPKCRQKRPADAYSRAVAERKATVSDNNTKPAVFVDRSAVKLPAPKAPCFAAPGVEDVRRSCYSSDAMMQLGIPRFYTSDEYGRVFETPVSYTTLPHAGPVPVARPSKTIQTSAINVPLNIYNNNNTENK